MKQLFVNGNATSFFFNRESSFDDIFEWVQEQVMFNHQNVFDLNEPHSCNVSNSVDEICISGDDDLKKIMVQDVKPIIIKD